MLVGGGVEDDLGVPVAHRVVDSFRGADVSNHGDEVEHGETGTELEAEVVHRGLGVVEEYELLDAEACKLAAQLGAYGACGAGDHHGLTVEVGYDFVEGDVDLVAAEEVFDFDFAHAPLVELSAHYFVYAGGEEGANFTLRGELEELVLCDCVFLAGEDDCAYGVLVRELVELLFICEAEDGELYEGALFARLLADYEASNVVVG